MKTIIFIFMFIMFQLTINSQWLQTASIPQGGGVTDMVVLNDGTIIVTTASFNWPNGQPGGIRRSTDGGATWQNVVDVFNGRTLHLGSTGKIFASYWPFPSNEGMYVSTNGGLNWTQSYPGFANDNVFSITSKNNDNTVFIGTRYGVSRSSNNGPWVFVSGGIPSNTFVYDLDVSHNGTYIAAGTSKGLYVTSDNGANWIAVSGVSTTDTFFTVKFANFTDGTPEDLLFAGARDGNLWAANSNNGYSSAVIKEVLTGIPNKIQFVSADVLDNSGIAGLMWMMLEGGFRDNPTGAGFCYSQDRGDNWIQYNDGLPTSPKGSSVAYQMQGNNIKYYAGTFENTSGGAKVYAMTSTIGIQQISNEIPNNFSLSQNYPNPFNPVTNIEFAIPKSSFVKLAIHDMLGREVETLISKDLNAGTYRADWNASIYTSGVYFYKLITEGFSETKKMILIK